MLPGSKSLAWLMLQDIATVPEAKQHVLEQVTRDAEGGTAWRLAKQFLSMVRTKDVEALEPWLEACRVCGIAELRTFAAGLNREVANVRAAVESPYSNGVAEGNVTRLKQIRRAMYGRGNFDLLRLRVLAAA